MTNRSKKSSTAKSQKLYTFTVLVSFEMQFTFTANEVQPDEDTDNAFEPTDKALLELERELKEYLFEQYPIESVEVSTDSDLLLGISEANIASKPIQKKSSKS